MEKRVFVMAKWMRVLINFVIGISVIFGALLALFTYFTWGIVHAASTTLFVSAFMLCLALFGYSVSVLPRMRDAIVVTDRGISQEKPNGEKVTVFWGEEIVLRNRPILGRLEVTSGSGDRVIHLEHQLAGYHDLVKMLRERARRIRGV